MSYEQPIAVTDNWFTGEDRQFRLRVFIPGTTQAAAEANTGTRQNITGWTIQWALMKSQHGTTPPVLVKQATVLDYQNGEVVVYLTHAETTGLEPGEWFHTWARVDGGEQGVLAFGQATLRHGAIR